MSADNATVAEEEYLQTLFWLHEAGLAMTGANVARAMQLSAPTVHEMIGRLERDGYITRGGDKAISFTESGQRHAEEIVRRHRLIERFLTDVLGIPWDEVHEEAERLEHAMSPVLEERMLAAIGDAKTCPHGHPITPGARIEGVPLADVELGATVTILRFENEAEDLLHHLRAVGLEPGMRGSLADRDAEEVVVEGEGRRVALTPSVAETVSVLADPSPPKSAPPFPSSSCSPRTATAARRPVPLSSRAPASAGASRAAAPSPPASSAAVGRSAGSRARPAKIASASGGRRARREVDRATRAAGGSAARGLPLSRAPFVARERDAPGDRVEQRGAQAEDVGGGPDRRPAMTTGRIARGPCRRRCRPCRSCAPRARPCGRPTGR